MAAGSRTLAEWNSLQAAFISILSGACSEARTRALRYTHTGNRPNTLSKTALMKSDGQQKQPLIPPQRNKRRGGRGRPSQHANRRERDDKKKENNNRTRQRAGQAVGLTQQEGLFNKHELEPSAIECYNGKLMQMRADLMTKWSG